MTDEKITYDVMAYGDSWESRYGGTSYEQRYYWPSHYFVIARSTESGHWYLYDGTEFPTKEAAQRQADSLNANPPKVA